MLRVDYFCSFAARNIKPMMTHDIFISYSSKQKSIADGVCHYLEENGFKCWMAPRDIPVGSEYGDLIEEAIKTSKVVVLVFSQAASISKWVKGEINVAFTEDKPILPFRVDETEIKGGFRVMLNQMHWIDAFPQYADRLPDLLSSICGLLGRKARKVDIQSGTTKSIGGKPNIIDGHEYVDLGLPSGTLWATCNIGADKPEVYGYYFAWGEIQPKTEYDGDTYKYGKRKKRLFGDDLYYTKYCNKSSYGYNGFTDNLITLESSDDAATAYWGSGWQTPSKAQWDELLANTTNQWTTKNGMEGRQLTSKKNGQTLFLPAAGYRHYSRLNDAGGLGNYWSSSLNTDYPDRAWYLYFSSHYYFFINDNGNRYNGHSVRPVRSSRQN